MKPDEQLREVLPLPPVAIRVFHPQDTMTLLAELYDNSSRSGHGVDFLTTVRREENGETVFESRGARSVEGGNWREWYSLAIPAKDFRPGRYVLSVRATSRAGDHAASREVPFEVSLTPPGIGVK